VKPVEPWNGVATVKVKIFVLNAVNLATIALCLALVATVGTVTYKKKKRRLTVEKPILHPVAPDTIAKILESTPISTLQPGSGEPRERLLNAYARAKNIIEKASAMKLEPHMTMREFSRAIEKKGIAAAGNFATMTGMAEVALYSPHATESPEAAKAEELLSMIAEGIQRGTA
jgi:hypothetical protein